VALSADDPEHARLVWRKLVKKKFPVLSDAGAKVIREYGLLDKESHGEAEIAIRTTLLVDEKGVERWRLVSAMANDIPAPEDVLQRIRDTR
jgi:peroxiredoxin